MSFRKISSMWLRALKFYIKADTIYRVHSPYLYSLLDNILDHNLHFYDFDAIEGQRHGLLANQEIIDFTELGAGSRQLKSKKRKIADIAKTSLSPSGQCQILYRLIEQIKPDTILEMGTSLGIATSYLAKAYSNSQIITLEGDDQIANRAQHVLKALKINNVEIIQGHFDTTLPIALNKFKKIDIGFIDGNHTYEATVKYYKELLPFIHDQSILIFDDIHWTSGMEKAWEKIRSSDQVTASIDLFYFGIIFFKKEFVSETHHNLVPTYLKPWTVLLGI